MRTLDMELSLMNEFRFTQNIVITNVFNAIMFEVDLLSITPSGYATGVEIKISASDLKNDLKKKHIQCLNYIDDNETNDSPRLRHYYGKLKYFYYAVPEYLKEKALKQIPSYAGLIEVRRIENCFGEGKHKDICYVIKKPTELFKYKWSEKEQLKIAHLGCMRINNLKKKLSK